MSYWLKIFFLTTFIILQGCASYSIEDAASNGSEGKGVTVEVLEQEHIEEVDLQAEERQKEEEKAKRSRNKAENPDDDMQRLD